MCLAVDLGINVQKCLAVGKITYEVVTRTTGNNAKLDHIVSGGAVGDLINGTVTAGANKAVAFIGIFLENILYVVYRITRLGCVINSVAELSFNTRINYLAFHLLLLWTTTGFRIKYEMENH